MTGGKEIQNLRVILDDRVELYNRPDFIAGDPISIPHRYSKLQDREIAGLWTALLSWGQRKTIIQKASLLMELMDNSPHAFIVHHSESDRKRFLNFVHRTFQPDDALYFLHFLQQYYRQHDSLEDLFAAGGRTGIHGGLIAFRKAFLGLDEAPARTAKHVSSPEKNSSCKRLNMFLRWMVRRDENGVDFGLWKKIAPSNLIIPLDVHVQRVALRLGLLSRKQADWKAAVQLTESLKLLDPADPVKYDFALFGMGVMEKKKLG